MLWSSITMKSPWEQLWFDLNADHRIQDGMLLTFCSRLPQESHQEPQEQSGASKPGGGGGRPGSWWDRARTRSRSQSETTGTEHTDASLLGSASPDPSDLVSPSFLHTTKLRQGYFTFWIRICHLWHSFIQVTLSGDLCFFFSPSSQVHRLPVPA